MPFDKAFRDAYELGIKAACIEARAYCERLDEQIFHENMLQRVYNQIAKADLIIADMTGRNSNVFYETGYAHALNKKVILLTRDADDIPFDLKHYPHIVYGGSIAELKTELTRRVKWFLEQPHETTTGLYENLRLYIDRQDLASAPELIAIHSGGLYTWTTKLNVHNSEDKTLRDESFRIGLISPNSFETFEAMSEFQMIELPDNRRLHLRLKEYVIWRE